MFVAGRHIIIGTGETRLRLRVVDFVRNGNDVVVNGHDVVVNAHHVVVNGVDFVRNGREAS